MGMGFPKNHGIKTMTSSSSKMADRSLNFWHFITFAFVKPVTSATRNKKEVPGDRAIITASLLFIEKAILLSFVWVTKKYTQQYKQLLCTDLISDEQTRTFWWSPLNLVLLLGKFSKAPPPPKKMYWENHDSPPPSKSSYHPLRK